MSGPQGLAAENIWLDKHLYDEAERRFYEAANAPAAQQSSSSHGGGGGDQVLVSLMKGLRVEDQSVTGVATAKSPSTSATTPCTNAAPGQQVRQEQNGGDGDIDRIGGGEDERAEEECLKLLRAEADADAGKKTVMKATLVAAALAAVIIVMILSRRRSSSL